MKQILKNLNLTTIVQAIAAIGIALMPLLMMAPQVGHAQLVDDFVDDCPEETGIRCNEGGLAEIFVTVINWALAIAFILAVIFLIYGGFRYILAGGNEEGAKAGRTAIFNALIGVVIIVLSYVIVQIVYRFVSGDSSGGGIFGS
ncbi:hypothetical protein IPM19_04480 [bacterium]|nr:MAG: hypothetical protein IPM19_04480 [bacterium]